MFDKSIKVKLKVIEILTNRVIIEVFGKDAGALLQNLITNDLKSRQYIYTYMLSAKGKYLADFFICSTSQNSYLIDIAKKIAPEFIARLQLFKLRAEAQTCWQEQYKIIYAPKPPEALESLNNACLYINKDPRAANLGWRCIINSEAALSLAAELGADSLYLQDKYALAIPDGETDLLYEQSFPIEYGAEELNAISYSKGCYMGQEVVSRTKYQGVVRKKIFKVTTNADFCLSKVQKGAELSSLSLGGATKKIGIFNSGYEKQGLALIREEYVTEHQGSYYLGELPVAIQKPLWR